MTVHRWVNQGRLRAWKLRGPVKSQRFVSRADVLALLEPEPIAPATQRAPSTREEDRQLDAAMRESLKRRGLDKYLQK